MSKKEKSKKTDIKTFKIPFLPIHVAWSWEITAVRETLKRKWVSDKVSENLLAENFRYKNRYGPLD